MADQVKLLHVKDCNLGKLGADSVALRINFAMSAEELENGPVRHAVFGLSRELARGLAHALASILESSSETPATSN